MRFDSLLTDTFDEHLSQALERDNPHTLENAVDQLTDYAQLKNEAQEEHRISVDADKPTGDANPNHGYQSDGDVELVSEQHSSEEARTQTDFGKSNPEADAIDHRHRDAKSHLDERMSNNHRHHTVSYGDKNDASLKPTTKQTPSSRKEDDTV